MYVVTMCNHVLFICTSKQQTQSEVVKRCLLAEPHYGENWCAINKDIKNWKRKTDEILTMVANSLPIPT